MPAVCLKRAVRPPSATGERRRHLPPRPQLDEDLPTQGGVAADFNGDGWPDLAFSDTCDEHECANRVDILLNWTGQPAAPCVVSDVTGGGLRDAADILRSDGCRIGRVSHRSSREVHRGLVISQRPSQGAVLASHGRVDLVISSGR